MTRGSIKSLSLALAACCSSLSNGKVVDYYFVDTANISTTEIPSDYEKVDLFKWKAQRDGVTQITVNVTGRHLFKEVPRDSKMLSIFLENNTKET